MSKKEMYLERVIVTDFTKLKKSMFEGFESEPFVKMQGEVILISKDGRLFINEKSDAAELLKNVWDILLSEDIFTLSSLHQMFKEKYPDAKMETIHEMEVDEQEKMKVFAALLVPVELKRRAIKKAYFGF